MTDFWETFDGNFIYVIDRMRSSKEYKFNWRTLIDKDTTALKGGTLFVTTVSLRDILPENLDKINGSVSWANGWNFFIALVIIRPKDESNWFRFELVRDFA